jgi:hypothetical protein
MNESPQTFPLPQGAPLLLWSDRANEGYVLGLLDVASSVAAVNLSKPDPERLAVNLEVGPSQADPAESPRLYVERVSTGDPTAAFAGYREALAVVAPAPSLPPGFRQQWGSWYAFGGGMNEELLRQQIDMIARSYADLGPWQIVVDAGWYRSGADPEGRMGLVDEQKFPSGMRALVDYAHDRVVDVVLYGAAPWVDSRPDNESWWVVQRGLVRDHPDWLIKIDEDESGATYVYDFSNPELRAYLGGLIREYLVDFDADGIMLDMMGIVGSEGGPFRGDPIPGGGRPAVAGVSLNQTLDIYRSLWNVATRIKPEAWIEGAWATPPLARPYAHTWRLADEYPAFSNPYPFPGLLEQVTYAVLQVQMLDRRPHLGFVYGPDVGVIQREWLAAAVALQAQVALSIDLANITAEEQRSIREYLQALRPFSGATHFGPGIPAETFGTLRDGTLYLGLLNPSDSTRAISLDLADFGFSPRLRTAAVFDPTSHSGFITGRDLTAEVTARSLRLLVVRSEPGVLWGDRETSVWVEGSRLAIDVTPGTDEDGEVFVYAPGVPHPPSSRGVAWFPLGTPGLYGAAFDSSTTHLDIGL